MQRLTVVFPTAVPPDTLLIFPYGDRLLQVDKTIKVISRMLVPTSTPLLYSLTLQTTSDFWVRLGVNVSCPEEVLKEKVPVAHASGEVAL